MAPNCEACFELGGGGHVGFDPDSGKPDSPHFKIVFFGSGRLNSFEAWLGEYGHLRFGGAIDNSLAVHRGEHPEWAGELDLTTPRTQHQREEAEAATRRFPFWGSAGAEKQSKGLVLSQR